MNIGEFIDFLLLVLTISAQPNKKLENASFHHLPKLYSRSNTKALTVENEFIQQLTVFRVVFTFLLGSSPSACLATSSGQPSWPNIFARWRTHTAQKNNMTICLEMNLKATPQPAPTGSFTLHLRMLKGESNGKVSFPKSLDC